jgi:hypothetical protein
MTNIYCDLLIDGVGIWYGVPCLNLVAIGNHPNTYLDFTGILMFQDSQGEEDPVYTGMGPGGRFALLYIDPNFLTVIQVPTQAVPAQQFDIVLSGQNCTIALYTK